MKKYLIIGGAVVVVLGLAVGGYLVWRSRGTGGGPPADNNGPAAGEEQKPSSLKIQLGSAKEALAAVAIPADASGKPVMGVPKEMSAAEKTALGVPAGAQATITLKPAESGPMLVGEITVTKPAADSQAAGGTASGGTISKVSIVLPAASQGTLGLGASKELSAEEKANLGLPAGAQASVTLQPATGGGVVAKIQVSPPPAETGESTATGTSSSTGPADQNNPTPNLPAGCGDFLCSPDETATSCPQDCVLAEPTAIVGQMTISGKDSGTEFHWLSNVPTKDVISYGFTQKFELGSVNDDKFENEHTVLLPVKVKAGQILYYQIKYSDRSGNTKTIDNGGYFTDGSIAQ